MSTTEIEEPFDLREQMSRIDRAQAETRKFVAEQQKLIAEQQKLAAEGKKYERERLTILMVASAAVGAVLASLLGHVTIVLPRIGP